MVIAHEFAHILQYKSGLKTDGPWQMEPHADFMAGWLLAQSPTDKYYSDAAAEALFALGDTEFNSPDHHGQPELRAAMVRAGHAAGDLDVQAAFAKGRKFANLK
jgi:hypothetical protein